MAILEFTILLNRVGIKSRDQNLLRKALLILVFLRNIHHLGMMGHQRNPSKLDGQVPILHWKGSLGFL